jgi:hypothetical protein
VYAHTYVEMESTTTVQADDADDTIQPTYEYKT